MTKSSFDISQTKSPQDCQKNVEKALKILFENVVDMTTTFSIKIFLHYSTKSNGNRRQSTVFLASRIRPHFSRAIFDPCLQNTTIFDKIFCQRLSYFVEILLKKLQNYNSTIFFAKFRTRKLKNLQIQTNFAHKIYLNLSNYAQRSST